jgi:hypothetical protein
MREIQHVIMSKREFQVCPCLLLQKVGEDNFKVRGKICDVGKTEILQMQKKKKPDLLFYYVVFNVINPCLFKDLRCQ